MFSIVCLDRTCSFAFGVVGEPHEVSMTVGRQSDFWPEAYRCPKCGGKARAGGTAFGVKLQGIYEVQEAFRALEGLGLPEDLECTEVNIQQVLLNATVTAVRISPIPNEDHGQIEWLEVATGERLYFCSSSFGASIYRIVRTPQKVTP